MRNWIISILKGLSSFNIWPQMNAPKIMSDEEAFRQDVEAIRKDWEQIVGKF